MGSFRYIISTLLFLFTCNGIYGKNVGDSTKLAVSHIDDAYKQGKLPEKIYLDSIYVTMRTFLSKNILFTNKELLEMLAPYRAVIWSSKDNYEHKRKYYGILSNQAQMSGRDGEMLYYGEKIDNLERTKSNRPSLTALTIIADYYEIQQSPEKVKAVFEKEKKYLLSIPSIARKENLDVTDLVQVVNTLEKSGRAVYELKDTAEGDDILATINKIAAIAKDDYKANDDVMANILCAQITVSYSCAVAKSNPKLQQEQMRKSEALLVDSSTPDYLKYYIQASLLDRKIEFYLKYPNTDSAKHYLDIYDSLTKGQDALYNIYRYKKFRAQNLYNEGKYKESASLFFEATRVLDSSRSFLVKDVDDMLYARAKTEEQELLLTDANAKRQQTEKRLLTTSFIIALLFFGGLFFIQYIRRKQKSKFMEFKLNMARNIHDETNPALLYAKALAKTNRLAEQPDKSPKSELEAHIEQTMEIIRSLSHDLKSDKQYVIGDLSKSTAETLKKLNGINKFTFNVDDKTGSPKYISHFQFTQLKSILNECITNTVKHASFDKIDVGFRKEGNKLTITYKDNGAGWDATQTGTGIGLENIRERTRHLNGELAIQNNYPDGYYISVIVLLR